MHCPDDPAPAARPCFSAVLSSNTADVISSFRFPAALPICYVVTVLCVLRYDCFVIDRRIFRSVCLAVVLHVFLRVLLYFFQSGNPPDTDFFAPVSFPDPVVCSNDSPVSYCCPPELIAFFESQFNPELSHFSAHIP